MKLLQHGDINLELYNGEIKGEKIKHNGFFVVAEGEQTGHKHVVTVPDLNDMDVYKDSFGGLFLVLRKEGTITHEEHGTIKIAPATYRVDKEREKDWFSFSVRKVVD